MAVNPRHARAAQRRALGGLMGWQVLSALLLLAMAGIHIYLVVFAGFGGLLGTLFILNGLGGLILAIAILGARRGFLALVSLLGLLFMGGTLLGLVIALTVPAGLLGIHESIDTELVPTTLVVESIGLIVLGVTSVLALRARRRAAS
jgi:hypothetical protein